MTTDQTLNIQIARLLGHEVRAWAEDGTPYLALEDGPAPLPDYQGDELEGMRLVDFIHQRGYNVGVNTLHDWDERCECTIYPPNATDDIYWSASAPTRPRAICLAALALAAVGEGNDAIS